VIDSINNISPLEEITYEINPDVFIANIHVLSKSPQIIENIKYIDVISTVGWCDGAMQIWHENNRNEAIIEKLEDAFTYVSEKFNKLT
jgi:hypothetical protein